ncbi:MAG: type VI secretion system tip protein TssI/VgrG [Polyangiaceae bacterium]
MDHEQAFSIRFENPQAPPLSVLRFAGREAMNDLSFAEIVAYATEVEEATVSRHLLGARAVLSIRVPGGEPRALAGIVSDVTWLGRMANHRRGFQLRLVPRAWLLTRRVGTRVFQEMTAAEIAAAVLAEHRVPVRLSIVGKYPVREYCVQYHESDWDFITRLFAEEAFFFWFEQPTGDAHEETLVVADSPRSYGAIPGTRQLRYRRDTGGALALEEDMVTDFRSRIGLETTSLTLCDYDFERPSLLLLATDTDSGAVQHPLGGVDLEYYDHHGEYEEKDVDADNLRAGLAQIRARTTTAEGQSVCRRVAPGLAFELIDHEIAALDRRYVVSSVQHQGSSTPDVSGDLEYSNRFEVVPADKPFPPPRPARRVRQTLESAVVTGPPGQEVYCDPHGRVKVQFHWDRHGKRDERSSCFLRVAQAWAGGGFGAQLVPRIGMEVLVGFLGGDPDRPLVVGCVPNAHTPPPYPLPLNNTRSVLRTRTSPGGGGANEISFEDRRGAEQLYLHAQRNLDEVVERDRTTTVGHDAAVTVGGDLATTVTGNRRDTTRGDQIVRIEGGRAAEVLGGERAEIRSVRTVRVDGPDKLRVTGASTTEIDGSRTLRVGSDCEAQVRGNHALIVGGRSEVAVRGAARATYSGPCAVNAAKGISLTVGSRDAPASAEGALCGDLVLRGTGSIEISASKQIRFRVGTTQLTLLPKELRIDAETIAVRGNTIAATAEKSAVSLGEGVKIEGDTVKLASRDEAILELDKEAKLDGKMVKIKPGLAAEMARREEREEAAKELEKVTVHLFDLAGEPMTDTPYEVSFSGYLDEGTSADGTVQIPAFPDVETARIRWGHPASSPGAGGDDVYEYEMEVYLQADTADSDEALRRKLHNLGHRGADLHEAIRHYQTSTGAPPTGSTSEVAAELASRHDGASPAKLTTEQEP